MDDITLTAEKKYSTNFAVTIKKFCLNLYCRGENSCLFVKSTEIIKIKAKDSKIVANPLFLGHFSKGFSADNMKNTGLKGSLLILMLLQLMIY